MQNTKTYYRSKQAHGYGWGGQEMLGIHFFVKHVLGKGYLEMLIDEAGLENGDLEYFAEHGLSLTKEEARKRSAAYKRQQAKLA